MNPYKVHIDDLPNEMLQLSFAFLPNLADRKTLSLVCRRWNYLAFDYSYLGRIKLRLTIFSQGSIKRLHKITRDYRSLFSCFHTNLSEEEIDKVLLYLEKPTSSLEEFICHDTSRQLLSLKLLSVCPRVKRLQLYCVANVPNEKLPVLEKVEELDFMADISRFDIIRMAPNLRRLRASYDLPDLPLVIQKLPLEHLRLDYTCRNNDIFEKCLEVTKLSSVIMDRIDQKRLEQLCEFCPLLTKLRINVVSVASLRCLASLVHLKVLSLRGIGSQLITNNDVRLPSVEIVEFSIWEDGLHFGNTVGRIFPNVHYVKFWHSTTGKVSAPLPRLRTLEISHCCPSALRDLSVWLSDLGELIVHCEQQLSGSCLPPMKLQQLTLKKGVLDVTDEMAKNIPGLLFLNLVGIAGCINAEKLPSKCTVRRYLRSSSNEILDIIK